MSVEAPNNLDTQTPQEPQRPVIPEAQVAPSIPEAKVSRRGFLKLGAIVGGAVLVAGGVGAGIWKASQGNGEQQPVPSATDSLKPQPSASETETAEADPLSALNLWKMTPEERLAAIAIDKEVLNNPEEYPAQLIKFQQAILNAGASDEEYGEWSTKNPTGTNMEYGKYIFDTYHAPMFKQLFGEPVNSNILNSPYRQIAELVAETAYFRANKFDIPFYKTVCELSSTPKVKDGVITFEETDSFPTMGDLNAALPNMYEEAAVNNLRKMMTESYSFGTTIKGLHYDESEKTVVPSYIFHK